MTTERRAVSGEGSKARAGTGVGPADRFETRHIGPDEREVRGMLGVLGFDSLDALTDAAVPARIRRDRRLAMPEAIDEHAALAKLRGIVGRNRVMRSMIGGGYSDCVVPPVIQRNILENPGWYTQYTPYQAEIAQGRLEALLNFQTMVADLVGLPLANASLLDEGTAAAEAMAMCVAITGRPRFVVASSCHEQTIAVVRTRAQPLGIEVIEAPARQGHAGSPAIDLAGIDAASVAGILVQYPDTAGGVECFESTAAAMHAAGALVVAATDLLALVMLRPPGEWGADIAVGSAQRFGVPMGLGGPHAAFIATRTEHARRLPGRIIGVSKDAEGNAAYRMAIQTREQHIRREKATSNICTAQALLAIMASMYAVYHGPEGLRRIARRVHRLACVLAEGLERLGAPADGRAFFDAVCVDLGRDPRAAIKAAGSRGINLGLVEPARAGSDRPLVRIALDETTSLDDVRDVLAAIAEARGGRAAVPDVDAIAREVDDALPPPFARSSPFLTHSVFNSHHSETALLRYMKRLENKDVSLAHSMIPLGSCTMKLNATAEMVPVTWPEVGRMHPLAPPEQWEGYRAIFADLERWLGEITGFPAVSLQPNSGAQGEYAGLLVIRAFHASRGQGERDVCLIPVSAHGTNSASAVMAGMRVVPVRCDARGNIVVEDLSARAAEHADRLAALMVTYPSTHGVFEETIVDICAAVHEHGGQVYMDGANMNAQVGLCRPGDMGADVCHLNLHKTFCIPHGGGGPGMGPIAVAEHLGPFLPGHPSLPAASPRAIGPVSAAPYGSASILTIPWMYMAMIGASGLRRATQVAILNANYMARRLSEHYPVLYTGAGGLVAHEFILDLRPFEKSTGVKVDDVAKRLMDFGFHAPTMSWPVPGTLMIEPTESESMAELDRFCEAMIEIRREIAEIESGALARDDNPLRHAPHTVTMVTADAWPHAYSRERAAFPLPWVRARKFWPSAARIDNAYGDRNLVCTCPTVEELAGG